MVERRTVVPESCSRCPHLDQFHSTCSHPLRQAILRDLQGECPLFDEIRAETMRDLADRMEDASTGR